MRADFDLHVHSMHSFDGIMGPEQIVRLARRCGLAGVAVTDHNTIAGGIRATQANRSANLLVIVGSEISTEIGDILGLFLSDEIKSRNSIAVVAEIHAQGGLAVLPHPYHHHRVLSSDLLKRLDGVEIYNGRVSDDFSQQAKRELVHPYNLIALGNSDAHLWWEIGRARTQMEIEQLDAQSFRDALTEGNCNATRVLATRSTSAVYLSKLIKRIRRLI